MHYDVFLSYNSREKEAVSWLKSKLLEEGIRVFLDDRFLQAGDSLPAELSLALYESLSCAVLLGPSGIGQWQSLEIDIAVHRAVEDPSLT